ncbi:MAG: hypothetical protein Q9181_006696 [Wetmoreana brouardii]
MEVLASFKTYLLPGGTSGSLRRSLCPRAKGPALHKHYNESIGTFVRRKETRQETTKGNDPHVQNPKEERPRLPPRRVTARIKALVSQVSKDQISLFSRPAGRKLSRNEASAQCSQVRKRNGFQELPAELVLLIKQYLPLSSLVALSHTCSRFYRSSSEVIEDIFDRWHYPREGLARLIGQISFLEFVSRDKRKVQRNSQVVKRLEERVCVTCVKLKDISFFSLAAQRGPAVKRQCIVHEGRLWVCPRKIWNFELAIRLCSDTGDNRHSLSPEQASVCGPCQCGKHFTLLHDNALIQAIPISIRMSPDPSVLESDIEAAKEDFHVRFCPHMSISNQRVFSRFSAQCQRRFSATARSCFCRICRSDDFGERMHCSICLTSYQFRIARFSEGFHDYATVFFLSRKILGKGDPRDVTHDSTQMWLNHISLPSELPGLKLEWSWNYSPADDTDLSDDQMDSDSSANEEDLMELGVEDPFKDGFCW